MARSRDIEYKVGFTGDTSQLEAAIKKATDSLTKLGTSPEALRKGIDGAARSALELSNHLNTAFNQNTGKLDLVKFQQSLKASGKDIQDYATSLRQLGPEGEQAFLEVASAIGKAELPLRRTNTLIKQFGQTLWNTARWRITTSAINAIVGGMQQAVGYAKSLDASLNNIRIVTGKSAEEMAKFAKEANTAAKTLSTTTTTYTDASLIYYQQGLDTEAVKQRTEATIKMANVTGQAAETISSQMTAIWENFDDGSRSLESFGDSLVALGATTAASSKEIAEGLQKFAPIAQTVGLSFDYASAALTTIVANTRESAAVAGNALKTLFSRLEGLKLGETLDDGTDLNKYSNALMAVGVNIKDVSGNLKDMDTILDELGAKWKTLAKDQQLALAETVGGVRQYAQLVALMDNWGDFQKNLTTAQTSEGALQRQADIYAESWEAARKRIKAATEDIYDSLINPDQFIKLDDTFTPLLTGIASAVDALGGLTGMLPLVVMFMNKAFGDKIAQSLRDMTVNIGLMTGAEQKRARALQENVATEAHLLGINREDNSIASTKVEILKEEVALQAEINSKIDEMPIAQQEAVNNELKMVEILEQEALKAAELVEAREQAAENARINIWSGATNSSGITDANQLFGNHQIAGNSFIDPNAIKLTNDFDEAVRNLTEQLEKSVSASVSAQQHIRNLGKDFKDDQKAANEAADAAKKFLQEIGQPVKADAGIQEIIKKLREVKQEATNARGALRTALGNLDIDSKTINSFVAAIARLTEAGMDSATALQAVRDAAARTEEIIQASSAAYIDWADALVKVGTYASQAAMAIRAIGNLKDVFSEDSELNASERWSQGLTSIAMMAPLVGKGISTITKPLKEVTVAKAAFEGLSQTLQGPLKEAGDKVTEAWDNYSIAQSDARAAANELKKVNAALGQETEYDSIVAQRYAQALIDDTTASTAADAASVELTKAKKAEAAITEELAVAENKVAAAKKAAWISSGVTLAIMAVVTTIALLIKHYQKLREEAKKLNEEKVELADKAREEWRTNEDLISSYRELLSVYEQTGEGKEELAKKAIEVANALGLEGAALANLTGDYSLFTRKIEAQNKVGLQNRQKELLSGIQGQIALGTNKWQLSETEIFNNDAAFLASVGLTKYLEGINYDVFGNVTAQMIQDVMPTSYEELIAARTDFANALAQTDETTSDYIVTYLKKVVTKYDNLLAQVQDYAVDAATIEVQLKDTTSSNITKFQDYTTWFETATQSIAEYGLSAEQAASAVKSAAQNLGLNEWIEIQNIQDDLRESLRYFPNYVGQLEKELDNISNLDDAKALYYLPWSSVDENTENFNKLLEQTKTYIASLEEGAAAALNFTNAEKLLQKVQSGGKLNTKDLEEYLGLFENIEEFSKFLTDYSQEEQEQILNTKMQDAFDTQQKKYEEQLGILKGLLTTSNTNQTDAFNSIRTDLITEGAFDYSDYAVKTVVSGAEELQQKWSLARAEVEDYYSAYEKASDKQSFITSDKYKDLYAKYGEPVKKELSTWLDEIDKEFGDQIADTYGENVAKYIQATLEIARYTDQSEALTKAKTLEAAEYERETNVLVKQVKTLGDLNKLQRTRNLNTDQYGKGILNLAKNMPRATAALKNYEAAMATDNTQKQADALRELAEVVEKESWSEAIGNIKEAIHSLEKEGMVFGSEDSAKNVEEYNKQINSIADSINAVFGDNSVTATWVEDNHELIQQWADGTVEEVQSAMGTIKLALYAGGEDFNKILTDLELDADTIREIVAGLDGIDFDINGYANVNQILEAFGAIKTDASKVIAILNSLNGSFGFEVKGLENYEFFMSRAAEISDPVKRAKIEALAASSLSVQSTSTFSPTGYYNPKDKGGGGSNKSNFHKDQTKDLEDAEDRYHEINRELDRQERILSKIETQIGRTYGQERLDNYIQKEKELTTTLEDQKKKSKEAIDNARKDAAKLGLDLFGNISNVDTSEIQSLFTEGFFQYSNLEGIKINSDTHEIENYQELIAAIVDDYNKQTTRVQDEIAKLEESKGDAADGDKEGIQERIDALKTEQETWDKLYDDRMTGLKNYENSLDVINTEAHDIEQTLRDIADNRLNEIEFKLQLATDVRDLRNEVNDFARSIAESVGDNLTHSISVATADSFSAQNNAALWLKQKETWENLQTELNNATEYTDKNRIIEQMKNLQGEIIATGEELLNWLDEVENMYADALSDASARFHEFTDQLAHNTEIVSTMKELYALQGVTYKTRNGFNELQKTATVQYQGYLAQAQANKQWYDDASQRLAQAEAKLAMVNENSVNYDALKKNRDALLAEQNEAQKAMLESAKNAMETVKQMQLDTVTAFQYELEKGLTNDLGFDLLQDKFDHLIEEDERYLDVVEEGLETAAWYSKLQSDIDKTRNKAYKERLTALQKEIDYRRENNTLSQYDLDILEARYQVLQAEMALEDARNNKTTLRLTRDEQGNWNYQYSADLDNIRDKEQELLKARQNEYEITKQRTKDLYSELVKMGQEYAQQDAEIRQKVIEGILTPEEGEKRLAELENYYSKKAEYLSRELNIARDDMSKAATESQVTAAALSESVLGTSSEAIQEIVGKLEESGIDQYQIASSNFQELQQLLYDRVPDFEQFGDDVRQVIQDIIDGDTGEGSSLYNFSHVFDDVIGEALRRMETTFVPQMQNYSSMVGGALQSLQGKITNVAEAIDVGEDSLNTAVDKASEKLTNLYSALETVIPDMWSQLDAVRESQREYQLWSDAVWETVRAMQSLAENKITPTIEEVVGEENNLPNPKAKLDIYNSSDYDFSQKMAAALYNDEYDKYEELAKARNDAIIKGIRAGKLSTNDNEKVKTRLETLYQSGDTETLRKLALGYSTISDTYGASTGASYLHEANNNQTSRILNVGEFEDNIERKIAGYYYNSQIDPNNSIWASGLDAVMETYTKQVGEEAAEEFLRRLKELSDIYIAREFAVGDISSFRSGGYTGAWNDDSGRLALLHQKELILNSDDTEKILEAVHIMRGISDTVFQGIAKSLDSAGAASMALLGSQLGGVGLPSAQATNLEQHVTIEQVNFPGVTSSREIEEAFESLVNDAAQWARRRKS